MEGEKQLDGWGLGVGGGDGQRMREQGETHNALYGQVLEDIHHHFCPVLLVRKGSLSTVCSEAGRITKVYLSSWEIDGKTVSDFILGGSKITADGDCSHEIKRRLLLGRKVMTNLDSIFKSRDITLPTKLRLVKALVFPVVMYGCESGTVKKAEH